jgi:predicted AAA+ superfamily ATPase
MTKPWREIAVPHRDVLEGTFQQSEFAADITAVHSGKASAEYGDAVQFFDRTYITEGMGMLLEQVAKRLSGKPGEPVVQLQTAFGGGKTHTMLAVYHLATRADSLSQLAGVGPIIDRAGLTGLPKAKVAVLDGTAHSPGQPWKHGRQAIKTLWGELAWQLGGAEAFATLKESDATGTSPGKDALQKLLSDHAPCVVLVDELVAYIRQFPAGEAISGGSYDSNLSFVQALTEAVKLVPNAVLLASLPESEIEAGSQRGVATLRALEKTFGRLQAIWKPVGTEEAFEIVRRRLFEKIRDEKARDAVCRAFADAYVAEGAKLPGETQEARYFDRLKNAYPIHPEIFDRLYEDWTTIDGFQRTRGVLKLMAKVIYRLWKDDNKDLMIQPGSLPLYDSGSRSELVYYLAPGWDAVLDGDIDSDRAETTDLETKEPRFGQINAARRVARTLFLGSAPSSVVIRAGARGLDRARVLLGCLQPGQSAALYSDALSRLADRLHYLNKSDDAASEATRFWFDTRANLRQEMEDRKRRFSDADVVSKLQEVLKKLVTSNLFDAIHIFTPHDDVGDDSALRLVVLPPANWFSREEERQATSAVHEYLKNHGTKPRHRTNRLVFLAPDQAVLSRLRDTARTVLAWKSIVDDVEAGRLNIDVLQQRQVKKELEAAGDVLPRAARECYRWLLCPVQESPTDSSVAVESFQLGTTAGTVTNEIGRICNENELVIAEWAPIHLRGLLQQIYWKADRHAVDAATFWDDSLKYLYLPRLKSRDVLSAAISEGAKSKDFFGTAYSLKGDVYEGFSLAGGPVQAGGTLLLIEPAAAAAYAAKQKAAEKPPVRGGGGSDEDSKKPGGEVRGSGDDDGPKPTPQKKLANNKRFHGSVSVDAATAKVKLRDIADELIALLIQDPDAEVSITVEINAEFPNGAAEHIKRGVSENANGLGFESKTWE